MGITSFRARRRALRLRKAALRGLRVVFALSALLPAALNTAPAEAHARLRVPLCTGDGQTRMIELPLTPNSTDRSHPDNSACCTIGCCEYGRRKTQGCCGDVDPAQ
jgi:hypothetical protein